MSWDLPKQFSNALLFSLCNRLVEVTGGTIVSGGVGSPISTVGVVCWILLSVPLSLVGGSGDRVRFLAKGVEDKLENAGSRGRTLGREVLGVAEGVVGATLFRGGSREEEVLGSGVGVRTFLVLFLEDGMEAAPTTPALRGGGARTMPNASRSAAVPLRCRSISGYAFLIRCWVSSGRLSYLAWSAQ